MLDLHGPERDRRARRRARHQRGRVRVGAARQGRDRHRQRRRAARRRPARRGRARPRRVPRSPTATARPRSCCSARTSRKSCPVLYLRIKRAAVELGVPLVDLAPVEHGLSQYATAVGAARCPGAAIGAAELELDRRRRAANAPDRSSSCSAAPSLAESPTRRVRSPATLAALPDVRFLSALRRGNVHGALDAGLAPGFLPGRVDARRRRASGSPSTGASAPAERGLDADRDPRAPPPTARSRCWCCSAPIRSADFPDAELAQRGIDGAGFVIAVDAFVSDVDAPRRRVPAVHAVGREDRARSRTSRAACSASAARSRPRAPRWTTGASRSSSRSASAPTSTSPPSTRSPTRSRASRPRTLGATAALLRRARDGVVLPCASTSTRSCSARAT